MYDHNMKTQSLQLITLTFVDGYLKVRDFLSTRVVLVQMCTVISETVGHE